MLSTLLSPGLDLDKLCSKENLSRDVQYLKEESSKGVASQMTVPRVPVIRGLKAYQDTRPLSKPTLTGLNQSED